MSNAAIIPSSKRSRGRPRKNASLPNFSKFSTRPNYTSKRKSTDSPSDEIEIIGFNGFEDSDAKKPKVDENSIQPTRSQPPRRARFTESYGAAGVDVVVISDDEQNDDSESESDSDCGPIPSPDIKVRSKEELEAWESNVETLKKTLNDEEMKLVLLKKLRESQKTKDPKRESGSPLPIASGQMPQKAITLKGGVQIQPLPSKQLLNTKYISKRDIKQEMASKNSTQPRNLPSFKPIQPAYKPIAPDFNHNASHTVEKLNSNHLHQYPLLKNLSNQITITPVPPTPTPSTSVKQQQQQEEKLDLETVQQRQAAAKLALRKELEKTLLQLPLPKPPPLKINFFPNANSIEFLCLLGLDYVVDFLTKSKKNNLQKEPLTCAQCSTDFTCVWKWKEVDKNGKKAYDAFCEACITSNTRKSLKAQHTNSLKSAFLRALQKEKEIDRLSVTLPKSHSSSRETPRPTSRVPAPAHQVTHSSSAFSIPKPGTTLSYIPKMTPGLNHAALAQLSKLSPQYQSLLQAQAQQLISSGVPLHPSVLTFSPFMTPTSNHSRGKSTSNQGDGRRQHYRSDRVQSPSIPQASSSWKA
ncbi:hypothetical protein TNIN_209341 [Trichonephila inaurata madagascariensis]|uniref:Transcriptional repressor p66 coiled-coil MBD2-interaction domain-containing protein n=1 Tax=Trichonephila inaurata madagascariensis TaxID=2747483 RepID=A0A8X6X8M0_9ARAC|nr:hypothetical protein TNIN_209341 [Trichonephila inaurata madagascariensis]